MNLWFRLFGLFLSLIWRPKLFLPLGISKKKFRVWPTDLDMNFHMNNGRYLTLCDVGRIDLMMRTGLWRPVLKNSWLPALTSSSTRYRCELRLGDVFELETKILGWKGSDIIMQHNFRLLNGSEIGKIAATSLVRTGFYDRSERRFISMQDLASAVGLDEIPQSPEFTPTMNAFLAMAEVAKTEDQIERT